MERLDADIVSEIFKRVNNPQNVINFCLVAENASVCSNPRIWVNLIRHYYPGNAITSDPYSQFVALTDGDLVDYNIKFNIINDDIYWGTPELVPPLTPSAYDEYPLEIQGNPPENEYLWIALDGWTGLVYPNQETAIIESVRRFKEYVEYEHRDCVENLAQHLNNDDYFCWDQLDIHPSEYTYRDYINNNDHILVDALAQGKFISYRDASRISGHHVRFVVVKIYFK